MRYDRYMRKLQNITKTPAFNLIIGIILGALTVLLIRFATYNPPGTHYHANFAVFIHGQREQFKGVRYYTEAQMCAEEDEKTPPVRAHMHDNINNVVHIEDQAVTWGHFFANIGWTLGPDFIADASGNIYTTNDSDKLNLILNGQNYTGLGGLNNSVIKDKDRLLISYGPSDQNVLNQELKSVGTNAEKYDYSTDPKSCGGTHTPDFHDRITHLF